MSNRLLASYTNVGKVAIHKWPDSVSIESWSIMNSSRREAKQARSLASCTFFQSSRQGSRRAKAADTTSKNWILCKLHFSDGGCRNGDKRHVSLHLFEEDTRGASTIEFIRKMQQRTILPGRAFSSERTAFAQGQIISTSMVLRKGKAKARPKAEPQAKQMLKQRKV